MKPVKTHTFRGRRVKIEFGEFDGLCESPRDTDPTPTIRILPDINTLRGMETLLHECLHICQWAKSEEVVDGTAHDIARLFRRLGYIIRKD